MPSAVALDTLRTAVRRRADMEDTLFVTDTEVDAEIQRSYGELYDLILESAGHEAFTRMSLAISTVAGQAVGYTVYEAATKLANPYKVHAVILNDNGTPRRLLPHASPAVQADAAIGLRGKPTKYLMTGPVILRESGSSMDRYLGLEPPPDGVYTVYVMYTPMPPDLTTGSTQNLFPFAGWEEYVICDAAAKFLEKEESDSRPLMARKAAAEQRIRWHARTLITEGGGKIRDVDDTVDSFWRV